MANTTNIINWVRGLIDDRLRTDGRNIYEYQTDNIFLLSESFVSSTTILVFKNGTQLTTGWTYNSNTNEVTITSLTVGDIIEIRYSYYAKYSDNEILNYINSALCYFVEYRYEKVFLLNDDDDIVAEVGLTPTTKELQFIALITAILIEPNNINIRTKEFTIEGKEKISQSEQIRNAFAHWTRNFGNIEFIIDEED